MLFPYELRIVLERCHFLKYFLGCFSLVVVVQKPLRHVLVAEIYEQILALGIYEMGTFVVEVSSHSSGWILFELQLSSLLLAFSVIFDY